MPKVKKFDANNLTFHNDDHQGLKVEGNLQIWFSWKPRSPVAIFKTWLRRWISDEQ